MKNNSKFKIVFLVLLLVVMTGCTKQLKDVNGKIVKNEATGQTLPSNILCKPTDKDIIKLYETTREKQLKSLDKKLKNDDITKSEYNKKKKALLDVNKLVSCKNFKVSSGGYEGLWTTFFVKPLAWVLIQLGQILKNYGLAVIAATLLIRLILFPVTRKAAKQSELMKLAQDDLSKIEKKYKNKNDQESMAMKSQEMMAIYKKHGINPMSGCLFGIIQIPLFLAFYEALYRLPVLFEDKFLVFNMATTPISGMSSGNYIYLILPILVGVATYFSFKLNSGANMGADQAKQMKTMMNIMMILIVFTSFSMSTAIIIYWITNSSFTIGQNLLVKRSKK